MPSHPFIWSSALCYLRINNFCNNFGFNPFEDNKILPLFNLKAFAAYNLNVAHMVYILLMEEHFLPFPYISFQKASFSGASNVFINWYIVELVENADKRRYSQTASVRSDALTELQIKRE